MEFVEVCKKREATRKFKDTKIDKETINKILEIGRLAPTAKNLQPQKIYVISSEDALEKVKKARANIYNAPVVLLVCSDKEISWSNGDYSTYEMDASIVATHLVLGATNYGVDNIWIEMFDKNIIKQEFNLEDNIKPICLILLGYRTDDYEGNPMHNERKELSETVVYL